MVVKDLTLEEKIGQMLIIGIGSKANIQEVINMIKTNKIGGVLLYKNNYETKEELVNLINKLNEANKNNKIPLFIAVDQEGGIVNRMPNEFLNLYSAQKIAATNDKQLIKESAKITGQMLKEIGFNLNFAPVVDLKNKDNNWLSKRCFSKDPKKVTEYATEYMKELNKQNIISVTKHFPGHGATNIDSHALIPVIKKYENLTKDLEPFKQIMKKGCDAIMMAHMIVKDVDKFNPCSLSKKFIEEQIRKELEFNGVIITDEVRMKGIRYLYGKTRPVIKAFNAGNDVILVKYRKNDTKLINKIKRNIKNEKELDKHVERILKLKEKYNISKNKKIQNCDITKINEEIQRINTLIEKKISKK